MDKLKDPKVMPDRDKKKIIVLLGQWLEEEFTQGDSVTCLRRDQPLFANVVKVITDELEREI